MANYDYIKKAFCHPLSIEPKDDLSPMSPMSPIEMAISSQKHSLIRRLLYTQHGKYHDIYLALVAEAVAYAERNPKATALQAYRHAIIALDVSATPK